MHSNAKRIKDIIKRISYKAFAVKHNQGTQKNIILLTSRRGGSTLLTQIISASSDKLRVIDHAFGWTRADYYERRFLPNCPAEQIISVDSQIESYLNLLETGELITKTHWNPFDPDFIKESDQLLYKITSAKALFDYFYELDRFKIIYQIRHPFSNALSLTKLGWQPTARAYLLNEGFCTKYLSVDQIAYSNKLLNSNDLLAQHVLSWCLENMAVLKSNYLSSVPVLSYEELVLNPEETISVLCQRLDINFNNTMYEILQNPSRSSALSTSNTKSAIKRNDRNYLIARWQDKISDEQQKSLWEILDTMEISAYKADDPVAKIKLVD